MKIIVVGAGVSAAHAALTLLERGHPVQLWDVGRDEQAFSHPGVTFHDLKSQLDDPISYFLGNDLEAMLPPAAGDLLKYPPSRRFLVDDDDPLWGFRSKEFFPFGSFNRGGLACGWGANALSYDNNDLSDWPIDFADMDPAYRCVYKRVPVAGPDNDDLSKHFSGVYPSQPAMKTTAADERLLRVYHNKKANLARLGVSIGLSRLAVTTATGHEHACDHCGRCLWGCPRSSIYNPALHTLEECESYPGFQYLSGRMVLSLLADRNQVTGIRFLDIHSDRIHEESCDRVFLAAGALQSGAIFLRTLRQTRPEHPSQTEGLMDTRVVKIPYVALHGIGRPLEDRIFQFNRLLMGIVRPNTGQPAYLHGELLHLNNLLYHPMIEWLPFDSRLSKRLFFALRSALGALTLFFPDKMAKGNCQILVDGNGRWPETRLDYRDTSEQVTFRRQSVATARRALWRLGCMPKGLMESRPGGGIHYAGTVPMGSGPGCCNQDGVSNLYPNLFIADGAAFPSLPSKSITLSLAAHATRVARSAKI